VEAYKISRYGNDVAGSVQRRKVVTLHHARPSFVDGNRTLRGQSSSFLRFVFWSILR
jgi:hypothetical protein